MFCTLFLYRAHPDGIVDLVHLNQRGLATLRNYLLENI